MHLIANRKAIKATVKITGPKAEVVIAFVAYTPIGSTSCRPRGLTPSKLKHHASVINKVSSSKVVDMRSPYMVDIGFTLQRQTGGKSVDIFGCDLIKFLNEFLHLIGWRVETH